MYPGSQTFDTERRCFGLLPVVTGRTTRTGSSPACSTCRLVLSACTLFLLALSCAGALLGQDTGRESLMKPKRYPSVHITLRPPKFWTEVAVPGKSSVSFSGPVVDGVVPRIDVICEDGLLDLDEDRNTFRSRVRVALVERRAQDIRLVDEGMSGDELERNMLVQTFDFESSGRLESLVAYHFSAVDWNFTVMFSCSSKRLDDHLDMVAAMLDSIVVDGEGASPLRDIVFWLGLLALPAYGLYRAFVHAREREFAKGRVADLSVLEREEASKGIGEMVIDDDDAAAGASFDLETGFQVLDLSKRKKDGDFPLS